VRDSFEVVVTDQSNVSTTNSLVIQIDDTVPVAKNNTASINENTTTAISGNVISDDDPGADGIAKTVIKTDDAKYGTLVDLGNGDWSYVLDNDNATVQALNGGQTLTETINYTITDGDGDESNAQLIITINGRNDPPTSADTFARVTEGATHVFHSDDFPFTDAAEGHGMLGVYIDSVPGGGSLLLDGLPWPDAFAGGLPLWISKPDLDAGRLAFKANDNPGGNAEFTFNFRVQDNGGTVNGGNDTSGSYQFKLQVGQFIDGGSMAVRVTT